MREIDLPFSELLPHAREHRLKSQVLKTLSWDTRTIRKGDWYIALRGESVDGHRFIGQALEKGAAGIISETVPDAEQFLTVDDSNRFIGTLATLHRRRMNTFIIGITGSNGKTSTKEILKNLLEGSYSAEEVLATPGNLNNHFGVPFTLLDLKEWHRFAVIEMGMNSPGEISYLTRISEPDRVMITSIAGAHIGRMGSIEAIAREKVSIIDGLYENGALYIHRHINRAEIVREYAAEKNVVIKYAGETARQLSFSDSKVMFEGAVYGFHLPGEHQRQNLQLAFTVTADIEGFDAHRALSHLSELEYLPGRMHRKKYGSITVYDDSYNANTASFRAAFDVMKEKENVFGILGHMGELGDFAPAEHKNLGNMAADVFNTVLFLSDEEEYRRAFEEGWLSAGRDKKYCIIANGESASIEAFVESLKTREDRPLNVLLKGSRATRTERALEFFSRKSS